MYNMIKIRNKHIHEQVYNNQVQPKTQSVRTQSVNHDKDTLHKDTLHKLENDRLEFENTSLKTTLEEQIELTEKLENQLYKIQMENKKIIRDNINKLSLDISTEINAQNIVFVESESEHSSIEDSEPTVKPYVVPIVKKTTLKPVKPKPPKIIKAKIVNKKLSLDK